jgi:hypothetical protein
MMINLRGSKIEKSLLVKNIKNILTLVCTQASCARAPPGFFGAMLKSIIAGLRKVDPLASY